MINNLFTIFDPSRNFINLNWISCILPAILFIKHYYFLKNRIIILNYTVNNFINKDLKSNLNKPQLKTKLLLFTIFYLIYFINLISLLPFIFTPTRHISITLYLSIPVWISIITHIIYKNIYILIVHLVPISTPLMLIPFIVIIETISLLIRPVTLIIRLIANIIAGHILICLIRKLLNLYSDLFITLRFILNLLLMLEISVAIIQAYVFIILTSLYIKETK